MDRARLPRAALKYQPAGRRDQRRPLKRLLDGWRRPEQARSPTPWQHYDDDHDKNLCTKRQSHNTQIFFTCGHEISYISFSLSFSNRPLIYGHSVFNVPQCFIVTRFRIRIYFVPVHIVLVISLTYILGHHLDYCYFVFCKSEGTKCFSPRGFPEPLHSLFFSTSEVSFEILMPMFWTA
jgi:hypothetical protein